MAIAYRLSWPFSHALAAIGVPVLIKVSVIHDREAGVYVGTSRDLPALVVEADSLDQLAREVHELVPVLIQASRQRVRAPISARLSVTDPIGCA